MTVNVLYETSGNVIQYPNPTTAKKQTEKVLLAKYGKDADLVFDTDHTTATYGGWMVFDPSDPSEVIECAYIGIDNN